ncbi:MAG: DUF5131 family protein [Sphingobacteriia bacterium]|nr:DUF5131 family protein [Sphingobacteriia bacterium]
MARYNWNPWHGCQKKSTGCQHCYVFGQDKRYEVDSSIVRRVVTNFNYPIKRNRKKEFIVPPGSSVATCFTSDFFIEEADEWRAEAWEMMAMRRDCIFFIITKRLERIALTLPCDWGETWNHVLINVTTENQAMADERIPIMLDLPLAYRGVVVAPILERVNLEKYLGTGKINAVSVGGESYVGSRITRYDDVLAIRNQCLQYKVSFMFHQTGSKLLKDGRLYTIPHYKEYEQAKKAGIDLKF